MRFNVYIGKYEAAPGSFLHISTAAEIAAALCHSYSAPWQMKVANRVLYVCKAYYYMSLPSMYQVEHWYHSAPICTSRCFRDDETIEFADISFSSR